SVHRPQRRVTPVSPAIGPTGGAFLVVGGDSEIGAALLDHLARYGQTAVGTTRRRERLGDDRLWLDLSDFDESWAPPSGIKAACVCAARSRLADCAADPSGSWALNVDQTARLVARLSRLGIYTLFLSSNQVFDGKIAFVPPDAPVNPVSEYGRQKAAAEERVLTAGASSHQGTAVLRLSRVLGPVTPTVASWASALRRGEHVTAFSDMVLAPVPVELVAQAAHSLMTDSAAGIFHLSGTQDVPYSHFARALALRLGRSPSLVREVSAATAGLPPGSTPSHTTLDSALLRDRYHLTPPDLLSTLGLQPTGDPSPGPSPPVPR
ncbi:MAG TPA: sugar nucleotide-binding protein, partial [Acidimicrobiales bacterium]|nr:sugar nucleotide-binding protein [Acidimicrobiales bacterium]